MPEGGCACLRACLLSSRLKKKKRERNKKRERESHKLPFWVYQMRSDSWSPGLWSGQRFPQVDPMRMCNPKINAVAPIRPLGYSVQDLGRGT